ncbi:hypothetical protein QWJ26_34185 [Streptomyces sp. CSDS2]|uniref:Secreted protein n=1 Tax=Streptomyces nogalater TaxID=38314 RepID=A0ABW0WGQ5_STRNO|nr:hypothetical protein [Streptomyces sp. CSDS2]MDN3264764.1 hypothetical protein [Streptomyces sp. CSDS2]
MALKKALACTLTALAMAGGAASAASAADDDSFLRDNGTKIASCDTIEIIDIPILSSANNNIDCSKNYEEENKELTVVYDNDHYSKANIFQNKKHD